jgi:hypothetical protein
MGNGAMFMGDLVLTENEISPVMKRLIDDGVEITAAAITGDFVLLGKEVNPVLAKTRQSSPGVCAPRLILPT